MAIKSCLTKSDTALTEATAKAHPPASSSKQKLIEKQEKMYYSLSKDAGFQKNIAGLKRFDRVAIIQKKYAANGVKITKEKIKQMMKNGVTVAKMPPIVIPKPPIVAPGVVKPPPIIPKPSPKIVSVPKEPIPKIVPIKPIPKELLSEFKEAKTLDEALGEWGKYGHGNPMQSNFAKDWSGKKKLETMNRMNAQMHDMEKWIRGRRMGGLRFDDGDQQWNGKSIKDQKMGFNHITMNHRGKFGKHGFGEKGFGSLKGNLRYKTVSGGNSSVTLRHEMGHSLWYDGESKLRIEFGNRYKGLNKSLITKNVSEYATKNVQEFFAESFTIYSSPQYKMGSLNKVFGSGFEELMEKILISDRKPLQMAKPLVKVVKLPKKPLVKFKEAKTLKEANYQWQKYGYGDPLSSQVCRKWDQTKQLEVMNSMNAQMHGMEKWVRDRKLGKLDFLDGDMKWTGQAYDNKKIASNHLSINYRGSFRKYGSGEKGAGVLSRKYGSVSGNNAAITLRHEMGHVLWGDSKNLGLRNEFKAKYKSVSKALIKQNVSEYAAMDHAEFFAESFTIYSSPQYKMGSLNKVFGSGFEELMEKILIGGS